MKKQNRMEKIVRRLVIVSIVVVLFGTLVPLLGSAVEEGKVENQENYLGVENTRIGLNRVENVKFSNAITISKSCDITPPEITDIQCIPANLTYARWINITANLTDDIEVNVVKLNITHSELGTANIPMKNTPGTNIYYSSSTVIASGTWLKGDKNIIWNEAYLEK
ncbi:MAG: hypothetical protein QMC80_00785 [Thermoplasmatales archaeon]|nr:hypothetical protein [Thermoplasmatales archaeon]